MDTNNNQYWEERYIQNSTGWDLGKVSPPLKAYFDQIENKELKILIPGAGNAYEAEYLHLQGFTNVYVVDWAPSPIENLQQRIPSFPSKHLLVADFFKLDQTFDLIIEQTFFCALPVSYRSNYVKKMNELLGSKGKIVGLLFQIAFNNEFPPYGGTQEEYLALFKENFDIRTMQTAYNSIAPRKDSELFIILQKKL